MNRLKFRVWDDKLAKMFYIDSLRNLSVWVSKDLENNIQQFVGLVDMHGKEIYEGDIIKAWQVSAINGEDISLYGVVEWNAPKFCIREWNMVLFDNPWFQAMGRAQYDLEVIGNKFENPELMRCTHED